LIERNQHRIAIQFIALLECVVSLVDAFGSALVQNIGLCPETIAKDFNLGFSVVFPALRKTRDTVVRSIDGALLCHSSRNLLP
jgi:hypothetical protein